MTERRTDNTFVFNTRTVGRYVSSFLIQQGNERLMEIQQHDSVVVEVAGIPAGLRQAQAGRRGVARGRGRCQGLWYCCPPSPLYIGPLRGVPALGDAISKGGGGQGGNLPPKPGGGAPTHRVSNPRRTGGQGGRTIPPGAGSPPI